MSANGWQANMVNGQQPGRGLLGESRAKRPLGVGYATTLADFREKPDCLFSADDVAAAGLVGSRSGLRRAIAKGSFPAPVRLPSGRLAWLGKTVSDWFAALENGAVA